MKRILTREDEVLKLATFADADILRFLEITVTRLSDQATISLQLLSEEKHKNLLEWLSASPYYHHHQFISESRLPGLGDWLLNHPQYKDWHSSSTSSLLLLHGITGSEKTNICSVVVDLLLKTAATHPSAAPFAYFYCSSLESEGARSSPDEVMRTILGQLAIDKTDRKKVRDFLWSDYEHRSAAARVDGLDLPKLRTKDCVELILELADQEPIKIIVDVIDRVHENDRHSLIDALNHIISKAGNVAKIFVTSRTNSRILATLNPSKKINLTSHEVRHDMEVLVNHLIDAAISKGWLLGHVSSDLRGILSHIFPTTTI